MNNIWLVANIVSECSDFFVISKWSFFYIHRLALNTLILSNYFFGSVIYPWSVRRFPKWAGSFAFILLSEHFLFTKSLFHTGIGICIIQKFERKKEKASFLLLFLLAFFLSSILISWFLSSLCLDSYYTYKSYFKINLCPSNVVYHCAVVNRFFLHLSPVWRRNYQLTYPHLQQRENMPRETYIL